LNGNSLLILIQEKRHDTLFFIFISLLAQRNEAKKVHHERQPKAFLGAQTALLGSENFRFAPLVDASSTQRI